MYNRYIRNVSGRYTRIPQEDVSSPLSGQHPPSHQEPAAASPSAHVSAQNASKVPSRGAFPPDGLSGILRSFLDQLRLDHVDTGDLLLLGLLFFLFREKADEELLVALGLLLIL